MTTTRSRSSRTGSPPGNVDALLLLNLEIGDPRIELMKNNPQMPCLALADSSLTSGLPTLMSDDAAASGTMIRHLALFGHKNIARVAGPEELGHSYIRDAAFSEITTELGMRYRCLHTDYTPESGAEATSDCSAWNRGRPRSSTTTT